MKLVTDKNSWNKMVSEDVSRSGAFLQSWEWGELQRELGHKIDRYDTGDARAQIIENSLPLGKAYSYIPRGPVSSSPGAARDLVELVVKGRSAGIFVRVESVHDLTSGDDIDIRDTKDVQPSTTLITDLKIDDLELLEGMHSKTRYNIRLADKKGVKIEIDAKGSLDVFVKLVDETSVRHGIRSHAGSHYEAMMRFLTGHDLAPRAFLATASHDGDLLAAALCIDWNGTRSYLHGASSDTKKNFMGPHLLHWELMKDAKSRGLKSYDWMGIAPEEVEDHPLRGVTRFKKGFGGEVVSLPGTVDVVVSSMWYKFYTIVRKFR